MPKTETMGLEPYIKKVEVITLAVAAERERCAMIAENRWRDWRTNLTDDPIGMDACVDVAAAIRNTAI